MTDLKATFNQAADDYNTYRPHYPPALFDTLITDTQLAPGAQLLEIGPGTGQATLPLAQRGYNITGVELGEHLAAKARIVLKDYKNVSIITAAFEGVGLPLASFDLIFSATAFHWIRPEIKFVKTHQLLRSGGYLAIIHTEHVSDERGDDFFYASEPIYQHFEHNAARNKDPTFHLPKLSELRPPELDTNLFTLQNFTSFPLNISYSGAEYAGLLGTYSPTLALPPEKRQQFLAAIKDLINSQFGGRAARNFAMTLTIARKI